MGKSFTVRTSFYVFSTAHCSPEHPVIYARLIFSIDCCTVLVTWFTSPHRFTVSLRVSLCVSPLSPPSSCTRSSRRPWGCRRKSKQSTGLCLPSQVGIGHACTSCPAPSNQQDYFIHFLKHLNSPHCSRRRGQGLLLPRGVPDFRGQCFVRAGEGRNTECQWHHQWVRESLL